MLERASSLELSSAPLLQYLVLLCIGWYLVLAVLKSAIAQVAAAKVSANGLQTALGVPRTVCFQFIRRDVRGPGRVRPNEPLLCSVMRPCSANQRAGASWLLSGRLGAKR